MDRREKLNQIIEQHYDEIVAYCHVLLKDDPHGAEDCAHDVFMLLLQKQKELNLEQNIRGWLYASADRIVKDYRKKQQRMLEMISYDLTKVPDRSFSADELLSSSAFSCLTDQELQLLKDYYSVPKGDRESLAPKYGMRLVELYKKMHAIREKLRKHLK